MKSVLVDCRLELDSAIAAEQPRHRSGLLGASQRGRAATRPFAEAVATWQETGVASKSGAFDRLRLLWDVVSGSAASDSDFSRLVAELLTSYEAASLPEDSSRRRVLQQCLDVFARAAVDVLEEERPARSGDGKPSLCLEGYLRDYSPRRRAELGVYFTPEPLAAYTVGRVHETLRDMFGLADGLADTTSWGELCERQRMAVPCEIDPASPFVSILEPAAGTGAFLVAALDLIYETLRNRWRSEGRSVREAADLWNDYVTGLLPRLTALELLPAACATAQLALLRRLADTGYRFRSADRLSCFVVNALLDPADLSAEMHRFDKALRSEVTRLHQVLAASTYTVILGNPPFRGVSDNTASWMQRLLRGTGPDGSQAASYYEVEREPLGEKKLWLQDDYVKFLRFAQWQIERAGAGVIGFVTNHGYLDNTTFRGVRHALYQTFDSIDILDLHGNRKKGERHPDGGTDESVFEIEQGVAAAVFSRQLQRDSRAVLYREVWGSRVEKLSQLAVSEGCPATQLSPATPHFLFIPCDTSSHAEYAAGLPINEVMPVNSTAAVTARDSFVVAFTEDQLLARMRVFRDPAISDEEIRARFFTRGRSNKYPPGDTRGWKLADARRQMMRDPDWDKHVSACAYRPFDRRMIYWADWMVDWPRPDVMCHMTQRENMALVTRRQVPTSAACNYFWLADSIVIDGLIRSDNRGSESVFPLFLADGGANFSEEFVHRLEHAVGLEWNPAAGESVAQPGPQAAFYYIYALFNSTVYRTRYTSELRRSFPRVLLPQGAGLWRDLAQLGKRMVREVLQHTPAAAADQGSAADRRDVSSRYPPLPNELHLPRGFPKYRDEAIWLGVDGPSLPASKEVWHYRVGTHQVCRKWVRDRQRLTPDDVTAYKQMLATIARVLALAAAVDSAIDRAGGAEVAFLT